VKHALRKRAAKQPSADNAQGPHTDNGAQLNRATGEAKKRSSSSSSSGSESNRAKKQQVGEDSAAIGAESATKAQCSAGAWRRNVRKAMRAAKRARERLAKGRFAKKQTYAPGTWRQKGAGGAPKRKEGDQTRPHLTRFRPTRASAGRQRLRKRRRKREEDARVSDDGLGEKSAETTEEAQRTCNTEAPEGAGVPEAKGAEGEAEQEGTADEGVHEASCLRKRGRRGDSENELAEGRREAARLRGPCANERPPRGPRGDETDETAREATHDEERSAPQNGADTPE